MDGGGIITAFGWALYQPSWLASGYAVLFLLFSDVKSRVGERWLTQEFANYGRLPPTPAQVRAVRVLSGPGRLG